MVLGFFFKYLGFFVLGKEGQEGELLIKGPNVFCGYWNAPHKTKDSFTSLDWFKTGNNNFADSSLCKIPQKMK